MGRSPVLDDRRIIRNCRNHAKVDACVYNCCLHPDAFHPYEHLTAVELSCCILVLLIGISAIIEILHGLKHLFHVLVVDARLYAILGKSQAWIKLRIKAKKLRPHPAKVKYVALKALLLRFIAELFEFIKGQNSILHVFI